MRDPAPREVAGPGLTVASDKPPRQVPHGAVGASTPGFSASEAAWPTRTHSHPMAYFVHVLKRATSPGGHQSGEPEPPRPCCAGAWPPGTGLWPDSGVKYSVRWPLGGLPGAGPLCCSWPARGHSAHSRFSVLLSRRVLEAPGLCLSPSPPPQFPGWPRPASWLWLCAAGSPAFGTSAADSSCGHAAARGQPHRLAAASPTRPGLPRASPSRTSPIRGPAPRESASTALALHTGSPANCQPWPHEQGAAVSHGAHRYHLGPRPDPAAARVTVPLFKPRHPPLDQQKLRPPDSAPGGTVLASGGGGDRHTAPRAPWFRRRRCSLCQLEAGGRRARCQPGRFLLGL